MILPACLLRGRSWKLEIRKSKCGAPPPIEWERVRKRLIAKGLRVLRCAPRVRNSMKRKKLDVTFLRVQRLSRGRIGRRPHTHPRQFGWLSKQKGYRI